MSFAFFELLASSLDIGKERNVALGRSSADTPRLRRRVKLDETETLVFELQATPYDETIAGTPHWPLVSDFLQRHPRLCAVYERLFPAISMKGYSVETVLVVLSCFSVASGLAAGITGAGGPPTIVAYSIVDPSKGAIRGLVGLRVVTCVLEMCVLAHSCCACAAVSQQLLCLCWCLTVARSYDMYCSHGSHLWLSRCTRSLPSFPCHRLYPAINVASCISMQVCVWLLLWDRLWALGCASSCYVRY